MTRGLATTIALAALLALAPLAALAIEFKPYGRGAFAQLRKEKAGRPYLVHYWSTTCPPCLVELPLWARLAREKKTIDLVFVNTDGEGDRARAQARLEKAGLAEATHYAFADPFAERLYFEADKEWRGELPFTALVGANGEATTVTGAVDDPQIAEWLAKAEKSAK